MEIVHESDSTVFYNLTIEYKNGESSMFITKYSPTDYWLNNRNVAYRGNISSRKVNKLTEYIDVEEPFDDDLVGGNNDHDVGAGPGGSAGTYSADYPTDCFGTVIITMEMITHLCQCVTPGHLPGGCNDCSNPGYYEYVPRYSCIDDGNYDPDVPDDTGGTIGGVAPPDPIDDTSIGAMIKPEECTERLVGDINGDCVLSEYERCVKNGYPNVICDCVNQGSNIADCLDNDCEKLKAISDVPIINTRLYQLRYTNANFEKGFKVSKNPNGNSYVPSAIVDNNTNNCNSVRVVPHGYTSFIAHTHPDCVYYKMFSAPDILKLAEMANKVQLQNSSTVQLTELTHVIVFNDSGTYRTYALRFDDAASVQALQTIKSNTAKKRDFKRDLKNAYGRDVNSTTFTNETDIFKQQEHLFKHLENYNLNISLYEANFDSNGKVQNWKKINKDSLEQEECI